MDVYLQSTTEIITVYVESYIEFKTTSVRHESTHRRTFLTQIKTKIYFIVPLGKLDFGSRLLHHICHQPSLKASL